MGERDIATCLMRGWRGVGVEEVKYKRREAMAVVICEKM